MSPLIEYMAHIVQGFYAYPCRTRTSRNDGQKTNNPNLYKGKGSA